MRQRLTITLDAPESAALLDIAQREDRDLRHQAHRLLREAIQREQSAGVPTTVELTQAAEGAAVT